MSLLLAGLSALFYGVADFSGGVATRRSHVFAVLFWSHLVGLAIAIPASLLLGSAAVLPRDLLWGGAAGIAGAFGIVYLYRGLAETTAAVVAPVSAVTGAVLPIVFGFATGERPGTLAWIGIALALPAIVLLSMGRGSSRGETGRAFHSGFLAGLGFAFFFILISRSGSGSGLWPLAAARVSSVTAVAVVAFLRKRPLNARPDARFPIAAAGLLDTAANILFLMAARIGMLALATVTASLYPAPTVVLARIVHKEKMGLGRVFGLVLALAGVALIGLG